MRMLRRAMDHEWQCGDTSLSSRRYGTGLRRHGYPRQEVDRLLGQRHDVRR
jgi:hypothetical protein